MPVITAPRLLAALASASLASALFAALPSLATGEPDLFWPMAGMGAVLPLAIVLPVAALLLPFYVLLRRRRADEIDASVAALRRGRILGALVGGAVGALLGVCAASHGQIAAIAVLIVTICGAILGYADACWREPPQQPARGQPTS